MKKILDFLEIESLKKKYEEKYNRTKSKMMNIELPEILGKIEPVKVNNYKVVAKNIYSIYDESS